MKVSNQPLGDFGRKGVLAFFFSETDSPLQLTSQFPHREEKSRKAVKQKQTSEINTKLWARANDWPEIQGGRPAYLAVFDRVGLKSGTAYLDAGCGAGMAAQIAVERGAQVFGLERRNVSVPACSDVRDPWVRLDEESNRA